MTREEFIKEVTDGLLPPPQYFPLNVKMNKEGYEDIDVILEKGTHALSPNDFEQAANATGAIILDVRHKATLPKAMYHDPFLLVLMAVLPPGWVQ